MRAVNATGEAYLTHTKLGEKTVIRLAIGNVLTTQQHVEAGWAMIREKSRSPGITGSV